MPWLLTVKTYKFLTLCLWFVYTGNSFSWTLRGPNPGSVLFMHSIFEWLRAWTPAVSIHVLKSQFCCCLSCCRFVFPYPGSAVVWKHTKQLFQDDDLPNLLLSVQIRSHPAAVKGPQTVVSLCRGLTSRNRECPESLSVGLWRDVEFLQERLLQVSIPSCSLLIHSQVRPPKPAQSAMEPTGKLHSC